MDESEVRAQELHDRRIARERAEREHVAALENQVARLTLERDEARDQFDRHVAWASEQAAALQAERDTLAAQVEGLRGILEWLNSRGGLGQDVHEYISQALSATPSDTLALREAYPVLREIAHCAYHALEASDNSLDQGYIVPLEEAEALEAALNATGTFDTHEYLQGLDDALSAQSSSPVSALIEAGRLAALLCDEMEQSLPDEYGDLNLENIWAAYRQVRKALSACAAIIEKEK